MFALVISDFVNISIKNNCHDGISCAKFELDWEARADKVHSSAGKMKP